MEGVLEPTKEKKGGSHMKMKKNWNENFDLNEHGDFSATEVEYEEGQPYLTLLTNTGPEFAGAILKFSERGSTDRWKRRYSGGLKLGVLFQPPCEKGI